MTFNRAAFLATIDAGLPFAGFKGWMPSELFELGEMVLQAGQRPDRAPAFAEQMVATARARYRDGDFANPFAPERISRTDLEGYREMMSRDPASKPINITKGDQA